jgi:NifU-like protein involved in Fe-S cluster formation
MDEEKIQQAMADLRNQGEMADADAVGTVGSPECGDMVRMWLKFREDETGRKVIDRASFQSFGCQTALAVASVATEMIAGKPVDEVLEMEAAELSRPLGALPPMKMHCGQMVEGALREALAAGEEQMLPESNRSGTAQPMAPTLIDSFSGQDVPAAGGRIRIVPLDDVQES